MTQTPEQRRERKRAYYVAHREQALAYARAYDAKNREKIHAKQQARREAHREEIRERELAWREANREESRRRVAANDRKNQAETLPQARRYGRQWTGPELELAARPDLTAKQVALMVGRTTGAVKIKRHHLRYDPATQNLAGLTEAQRLDMGATVPRKWAA